MDAQPTAFEPLPLRRRTMVVVGAEEYSIVSKTGEVRQVKARTAYEAFKLSGVGEAIRIARPAHRRETVVPKARFEDGVGTSASGDPVNEGGGLRMRSPVVSATDLDIMIRSLENASAELMAAGQAQGSGVVTNPTGLEVHGDGFDELIPATQVALPSGAAKPVDTFTEEQVAMLDANAASSLADKELSPEEVNKLLGGQ